MLQESEEILHNANITVGTITRTFTVYNSTDNTPTFNPKDFTNATEQEPSATVTSNSITVGDINVSLVFIQVVVLSVFMEEVLYLQAQYQRYKHYNSINMQVVLLEQQQHQV